MLLAHTDVQVFAPVLIQLAKIAVLVAVRVVLFVFVPQQLQGDVFLFQLRKQVLHGRHDRFVRWRPGAFSIKALFKLSVIDVIGQWPANAGSFGQLQILSHSDMGYGTAFGNFTVGQLVIELEP